MALALLGHADGVQDGGQWTEVRGKKSTVRSHDAKPVETHGMEAQRAHTGILRNGLVQPGHMAVPRCKIEDVEDG